MSVPSPKCNIICNNGGALPAVGSGTPPASTARGRRTRTAWTTVTSATSPVRSWAGTRRSWTPRTCSGRKCPPAATT
eukprot:2133706-Pyramimonas_sp.AAC.1